MKKIIALIMILAPLLTMAQKGETKTVKEFFNKYSAVNNYTSVEVTQEMFEMIGEMKDANSEMVEFMKKLKFVRYLEYDSGRQPAIVATGIAQVSSRPRDGNIVYVDGVRVRPTGSAKGTGTAVSQKQDKKDPKEKKPAESYISTGSAAAYYVSSSIVHDRALDEIDLSSYSVLMKSTQDGEKMVFLRKTFTSSPNDQEFVLINGNTLINIRGDLNIKHLYELEEIIEAVGEILPQ